ncbi:unnamed protein product [Darwinula stevensoni]|uniref:Uncharacterized protein n=1 Tax=Darwinula stevensoni TaxID=69355 RepID=A0A7R9FNK6_9CRUS|nr:unnamed protein product [Darwinula stevensoni]CAG0896794.1 unnamed protein product [Darwinula stevensoni]
MEVEEFAKSSTILKESDAKEWKTPSDVMQRFQLHRKTLKARLRRHPTENSSHSTSVITSNSPELSNTSTGRVESHSFQLESTGTCARKRRNPFRYGAPKQPRLDGDIDQEDTMFQLLNMNKSVTPSTLVTSFKKILSTKDDPKSVSQQVDGEFGKDDLQWTKELQFDWTIKTRLRLTSTKPLPGSKILKTSEEASGTTAFVRNLDPSSEVFNMDTSFNAQLQRMLGYWQYPSFPWIEMFPRRPMTMGNPLPSMQNPKILDSLLQSWRESFRSLCQLVRARQCPYFYILSHAFTCLVRAGGVGGIPDMHILLTPSTRGFREALHQEDIEFSMPLRKGMEEKVSKQKAEKERGKEDEGFDSLGSSGEDDEDPEREVDNRPESLLLIQGGDTHTFINFLLNAKSLVAPVGFHAGLPPTLLAPAAFAGAQLNFLHMSRGQVQEGQKVRHTLEIRGPILPQALLSILHLVAVHVEEYQANASAMRDCSSFNAYVTEDKMMVSSVFTEHSLHDCGLPQWLLKPLCNGTVLAHPTLDQVSCRSSQFYYSSHPPI